MTRLVLLAAALSPVAGVSADNQDHAAGSELESLRQQVEELNRLAVKTQSHVMMDVEYHFSNLWFAAQGEQWDLASFYLRETRSHLDWTVRIRPVRPLAAGGSVDLKPYQQSINQGGFTQLGESINNRDRQAFTTAYQKSLSQCYDCHAAAGMDYLKPHIPQQVHPGLMINSN